MSIRRKVGRFRVLMAAVLLAISTLVAVPAAAPPAHAQQDPCTPSGPNIIQTWSVLYDDRGVTLCGGATPTEPDLQLAYVQIVDLAAGAKLRLISDAVSGQPDFPTPGRLFNKRETYQWYDWIQSNVNTPAPGRLFSTTNASFFTNTSGSTTPLSLPELSGGFPNLTLGWAYGDNGDPAWDALKAALVIGNPNSTPQDVNIRGFPTNYNDFDVATVFNISGTDQSPIICDGTDCWDGTVAFDPLYQLVDPVARRTMVGVSPGDPVTKVYILTTTNISVTLDQAQDIIKSFGSQLEIQVDGGGSTQMWSPLGGVGGTPPIGRALPDVFAVYLAP